MTDDKPTPTATAPAQRLCAMLNETIFGKEQLNEMVVAALLAGGHVLLEGLPGLGKTVLAKSLAKMTDLEYKRIQFTPDLLPADITGTYILETNQSGHQMRFQPGPIFTQFLLADEINRASPKTQAALLEAMGEGSVTLMGDTKPLKNPFFMIATQNPIEMEGTNPLPEAQLDRFAIKVDVPGTQADDLMRIITTRTDGFPEEPEQIMTQLELLNAQKEIDQIFLPEAVALFISQLVAHSQPSNPQAPASVSKHVRFGASPRAAIWLARLSRSLALLDGRSGVGFDDAKKAASYVLGHRIILNYSAKLDGLSTHDLITELVEKTLSGVLTPS